MNKQEQIDLLNSKPFEVGDDVTFIVPYTEKAERKIKQGRKNVVEQYDNPKIYSGSGKILEIINPTTFVITKPEHQRVPSLITEIDSYGKNPRIVLNSMYLKHEINHLGSDNFTEQDWNARINFYQSDIEQVLWRIGYTKRKKIKNEQVGDIIVPEMDWNPTIFQNGIEVVYQRPFCWTLKEKQLLIDSIYNNIEIGKIVVRLRSWNFVESRVKKNILEHTTFKQIVDGKQRCNTLLEFIDNKFPDSYGDYWDDLSEKAKRKFFSFRYLTYGELGETATDHDVLMTFLKINHAGVPQSQEHLDFVKSLL